MSVELEELTQLILKAVEKARQETESDPEPELTRPKEWPIACTVGPGLEGAIACQSRVGYVNGSMGRLIYRGYDIFDLCPYSTYEEVAFLLIHGKLPTPAQLDTFCDILKKFRHIPNTLRMFMSFPVEKMDPMDSLRLGANLMRREITKAPVGKTRSEGSRKIHSDEDSIPMETKPMGEHRAIYEFPRERKVIERMSKKANLDPAGMFAAYQLIAGLPTITAAVARIRKGQMPVEPDDSLGHAANYLYMMTGKKPTAVEERVMDVMLILHADHCMNASTFATMVVASTLSDLYLSVGAGIAALNGPLHGGANEEVLEMLKEIGRPEKVKGWFKKARAQKKKVMGFGHRVYKAYDPRARVLQPLAERLVQDNRRSQRLYEVAIALEKEVIADLGAKKGIYPNVDYYSGLVYDRLGVPSDFFTSTFAVSRVAGWSARVLEYLENNRIFRPRALYIGPFGKVYVPLHERVHNRKKDDVV